MISIVPWLGFLDPLWCLWDENRQCLHDKAADTIVVNDPLPKEQVATPQTPAPPSTSPSQQSYAVPGPYYGTPYSQWAQPQIVARTNGLAVASLVCSLVGLIFIAIPSIVGIVFGFISRTQIRRSAGAQTGAGLALAGIIVGFVIVALWTLIFTVSAISGTRNMGSASIATTIEADYSAAVPSVLPACPSTAGITCLENEERQIGQGIAHFATELSKLQLPVTVEAQQTELVELAKSYSQQLLSLAASTSPDEYQQLQSKFNPNGQSEIATDVSSLVASL